MMFTTGGRHRYGGDLNSRHQRRCSKLRGLVPIDAHRLDALLTSHTQEENIMTAHHDRLASLIARAARLDYPAYNVGSGFVSGAAGWNRLHSLPVALVDAAELALEQHEQRAAQSDAADQRLAQAASDPWGNKPQRGHTVGWMKLRPGGDR